jgi:hypothetical protein
MLASGRSSRSASRTRHSTFLSPSSAERRWAASTIAFEKSLTVPRPPDATSAAAAKPTTPVPAARSRIVWPGAGASRSSIRSVTGRAMLSKKACRSSQPGAIASHTA